MSKYSPLRIAGMSSGLVQNRENFLLPDDAYPVLENAYVWRERILRKLGYQLLGRLQRVFLGDAGTTDGSGNFSGNLISIFGLESTATITPGSFGAIVGAVTFSEPTEPDGTLLANGIPSPGSSINWNTGSIVLVGGSITVSVNSAFNYYPGLPVMGIRQRELQNSSTYQSVLFDQKYAYVFNSVSGIFQEFIPGTTWNAHNGTIAASDFFWSTNYWVSQLLIPFTMTPLFTTANRKLFWVTNNTGQFGAFADPPRITDGVTWISWYTQAGANFIPQPWTQIDTTTYLVNWLSMLPFRGRMLVFNTWECPSTVSADAINYSNRIRWSTIGNPFIPYAVGPPSTGSWRDDIRGQGGFLDIPTSEDIVAIGFVRDNLVIYCERSTWQLRYTGRSIAPFQIERVNSELGAESPFSAVQFDTSLVGIGDKGVVECDSYKSERIDIKIPDLVFEFSALNDGVFRVHGVRDFINRLAFWTYPFSAGYEARVGSDNWIFPNRRLVYNYENDSWAIFTDSLTTLGTYQAQSSRTWLSTPIPWIKCKFTWLDGVEGDLAIIGGNQQGFVEILDQLTTNDVSLYIKSITGQANVMLPTVINSPAHNLQTGQIIVISGILEGSDFVSLNGIPYGVLVVDEDNFQIRSYNSSLDQFANPVLNDPGTYIGGGLISIRDNFEITSKKFNFLDEGQSIQLGYIDILMSYTEEPNPGAISLYVYLDYNDQSPSNTYPMNSINEDIPLPPPDTFFNSVIPTTPSILNGTGGTKFWQRVFCPTRANFITLKYTFSNAQMAADEPLEQVQIDAQVLWIRPAGNMTQI